MRQCVEQLGALPRPELVVAFCGGRHAPEVVRKALSDALGDCPIVGGAAAGAISRDGFGVSGFELILAAFLPGDPTPEVVQANGLDGDERAAGLALGRMARPHLSEDRVVAIFYDSVADPAGPRLHPAAPLVNGFYEGAGREDAHVVGGGLLTDMNLSDGWVFTGDGVAKHGAAALIFPKEIGAFTAVMHGCRPVSAFLEITRVEGAEVFELDGRPALDLLEEMLGVKLNPSNQESLSLLATLGRKHGDPFAPFDENAYVNRLILGASRERRSITIFEPDFGVGERVQIMARDNRLMLESVAAGVAGIERRAAGKRVLLSLYIDCAGRASARSGAESEEAEVAVNASPALGPLLGFYSGVEIAPVAARSSPLDWTAVLSTLYWRD